MKTFKNYINENPINENPINENPINEAGLEPFKYSMEYDGVSDRDRCLRYVSRKDNHDKFTFSVSPYPDKIKIILYDDMFDKHYVAFCPKQIKDFSEIKLGYGTDWERKAVAKALKASGATIKEINDILKKVR